MFDVGSIDSSDAIASWRRPWSRFHVPHNQPAAGVEKCSFLDQFLATVSVMIDGEWSHTKVASSSAVVQGHE